MINKKLQYTLRDINGKYYYLDGEVVKLSSTAKYLNYSPIDWEKTEVAMGRSGKDWGVFRNIILPLTFCKDGAKIVRYLAFEKGIDTYCKYEIYRRDENFTLQLISSGDVDFTQIVNTNETASVKAVENSLQQKLDAKENIIYEFDLTSDTDAKWIDMDGIDLQAKFEWIIPETLDYMGSPYTYLTNLYCNIDAADTGNDAMYDIATMEYTTVQIYGDVMRLFSVDNNFTGDLSFDFDFYYKNNHTSADVLRFRLFLDKIDINNVVLSSTQIFIDPNGDLTYGNSRTITVSGTVSNISFTQGEYYSIRMVLEYPILSVYHDFAFVNRDGYIKIKALFKMPKTATKAIRLYDLFKKVIVKIEPTATVNTKYFTPYGNDNNLNPYDVWVTSGRCLRGVDNVIKTTYADLKKSLFAAYGVSIGLDGNKVKVDKVKEFLQDGKTVFTATGINKYKVSIANEHRYNIINVGYADQNYDSVNGRQEFCTEQQWTTGILDSKNTLDLISPYRADPYGMEYVRSRKFISSNSSNSSKYGNENTDDSADNDVFMIHCQPYVGGNLQLFRSYTYTITGFIVAQHTIFNLSLSPHTNLLRNIELIKSGLSNNTKFIKFVSSKKNSGIKYGVSSVVDEDANINIISTDRLFKYVIYEFEGEIPDNLIELMNSTTDLNKRYGKVYFTDERGNTLSGFPLDINSNPSTKQAKTIRLLCSPTDDLTKQSYLS